MADVLKFEPAHRAQTRARTFKAAREEEFNFWPEVSQGLWVASDPQPADPANSAGRVLLEIALILTTTAAIAVAISFFVGAPPV